MTPSKYPRTIRPVIIPVGPSIAYVELTKGLYSLIDAEDVAIAEHHNWCSWVGGKSESVYAVTNLPNRKTLRLHALLLNVGEGMIPDHKNGNTLDNRRSANLRLATFAENQRNRCIQKNNRSGFKGVSARNGRWRATIRTADKKHLHLGMFSTPELAHEAYCAAAKIHHGDFARTE
jgi:hypothetical protein